MGGSGVCNVTGLFFSGAVQAKRMFIGWGVKINLKIFCNGYDQERGTQKDRHASF